MTMMVSVQVLHKCILNLHTIRYLLWNLLIYMNHFIALLFFDIWFFVFFFGLPFVRFIWCFTRAKWRVKVTYSARCTNPKFNIKRSSFQLNSLKAMCLSNYTTTSLWHYWSDQKQNQCLNNSAISKQRKSTTFLYNVCMFVWIQHFSDPSWKHVVSKIML